MLFLNIGPFEDLCNGTCLICHGFSPNVTDVEITFGHYKSKRVFIPRMPFLHNEYDNIPFPLRRKRFVIRLNFAMKINKAQGQTLDNIRI